MKKYCIGLILVVASSLNLYGSPALDKSQIFAILERLAATENPNQADQMELVQVGQALTQMDNKDFSEDEAKRLAALSQLITCKALLPMCTMCTQVVEAAQSPK